MRFFTCVLRSPWCMGIKMLDFNKYITEAKKWLGNDLKLKLIVILGVAGMALILLSQVVGGKGPVSGSSGEPTQLTPSEYAGMLEARLTGLISEMDGAGRVSVMITLEDSGETVYAQEEKRNVDKQQETAQEQAVGKTYQKENVEQKYIIVDGKAGRQALVKTWLEPRVQGVVVVCDGAGNPRVEQNIIHVVTTALNIPTTRVCVVKISK